MKSPLTDYQLYKIIESGKFNDPRWKRFKKWFKKEVSKPAVRILKQEIKRVDKEIQERRRNDAA